MSGLILLAFIIYHIAHFTIRATDPRFSTLQADPLNRYDVYSMMVYGFQHPLVSAFYILSMFLLALHLSHGSSSFFQSLGLNNQKLDTATCLDRPNFRLADFRRLQLHSRRRPPRLGETANPLMIGTLDSKIPHGPLPEKWRRHQNNSQLVAPNNRRRFEIIIVGSGLAGGSAAATLARAGLPG